MERCRPSDLPRPLGCTRSMLVARLCCVCAVLLPALQVGSTCLFFAARLPAVKGEAAIRHTYIHTIFTSDPVFRTRPPTPAPL